MAYDDLKEYGSESAVKGAGKLRQQGKPYESKHQFSFIFYFFLFLRASKWSMVTLRTGRLEVNYYYSQLLSTTTEFGRNFCLGYLLRS